MIFPGIPTKTILVVGAAVAVVTTLVFVNQLIRQDERSKIKEALLEQKIQVTKDGKEIDLNVENLGADGLCLVLGGCSELPVDTDGD